MQSLDRRAIEEFAIPGLILMENAGLRAADEIARWMEEKTLKRAIVLCGKGNNGGDGFVVARHLFNRGISVEAWRVGGDPAPTSDAGIHCEIALRMGIRMPEAGPPFPGGRLETALTKEVAAIDALLGTGLAGEVREPYLSAIRILNDAPSPVFSIDCPSGLDCDTGRPLGDAVRADSTVTFGAPKVGFSRGEGPERVGRLVVVDIGIPRTLLEEDGSP